jgi:uncharacterized protein
VDFTGSYLLLAERAAVWRALNDTAVLKQVIPGCHHIAWTSDTTLDLVLKVNLGVAKPKFGGELELSDVIAATSYKLSGRGRGGLLGLAHGAASIALRDFDLAENPDLTDPGATLSDARPGEVVPDQFSLAREVIPDHWPQHGMATVLQFNARGGGSGQIMALGKAVIGKSAQGIIDRFFIRFANAMDTSVISLPAPSPSASDASPPNEN